MRRCLFLIIWGQGLLLIGQESPFQVELQSFGPPSSPAFTLMDITPSMIVMPDDMRSFSLQTLNAFTGNSNDGLSNNNYAVELRPYLYMMPATETFLKYRGVLITENVDNTVTTSQNIFAGALRKATVSLALMDGTFEVFERPQSYVSIGVRSRLIEVKSAQQYHNVVQRYKAFKAVLDSDEVQDLILNTDSPADVLEALAQLKSYQEARGALQQTLEQKPLFAVDVASAYSYFMGDRSQGLDDTFGRFGVWVTTDLAFQASKEKANQYIHVYSIFRYLEDGLNQNEADASLFTTTQLDYGGKLAVEWDRLSLGFEYIVREGDISSSRTFGSIKYRINDAFTIHGGFGENFNSDGGGITLFGIQWGLQTQTPLGLPNPF